jgi:curli production assembly/transport component CsgF
LQSILLSRLAQQVSDAIFGQNPQQSGTITFGTQTITFNRTLENVLLTITDTATGEVTNVTVPTLQTVQ